MDGLIYFGNGEQYIVLSRENEVTHETEYRNLYLRPSAEGEQIATLRFRMTPARAVKKYANTEAMSLITEEVGTRAAAGFTIEEIKTSMKRPANLRLSLRRITIMFPQKRPARRKWSPSMSMVRH